MLDRSVEEGDESLSIVQKKDEKFFFETSYFSYLRKIYAEKIIVSKDSQFYLIQLSVIITGGKIPTPLSDNNPFFQKMTVQ